MTSPVGNTGAVQQSAEQFLMGGKRAPSAFNRNDGVGTSRSGKILDWAMQQQRDIQDGTPKVWPNGDPMMHLAITVQTDLRDPTVPEDDGQRTFYVKGEMHKAVKQAIVASGEKFIDYGGILTIQYVADGQAQGPGLNPPKLYKANYVPPAAAFIDTADSVATVPASPGPQLDPAAVQAAFAAAGLPVTPDAAASAPTAASAPAQSQSAETGPAVPPGTNPALAAALNAMTPQERAVALKALSGG